MSTQWVTRQILAIRREPPASRVVPNPWPVGQVKPGCTSEAVLVWLLGRPDRGWWTQGQIINGTARSKRAVDWALIYLRSTGRIEASVDDSRSARYLRYRAVRNEHER